MNVDLLDPVTIPKFVAPLFIPPVMDKHTICEDGQKIDVYSIKAKQFEQQILPNMFGTTTVWGYCSKNTPPSTPSATIVAYHNRPTRIKWINDLVDDNGDYLPHLLTVDPTLHWANPPGGVEGRDSTPTFITTPGPYLGPVPIVTHVHGASDISAESDGYASAWYLPNAKNIPKTYATEGSWYNYFKNKASNKYDVNWKTGNAIFQYTNKQLPTMLWYHDHTLGMVRTNVYAGLAGFYKIDDCKCNGIIDKRTCKKAVLPKCKYEIALAIQDKTFTNEGKLFFPKSRADFGDVTPTPTSYIPYTDIPPMWNPEFFGTTIVVNGNTWPFFKVERRRYRFRVLNACNARTLVCNFTDPRIKVWQIGTDSGFTKKPVYLNIPLYEGDPNTSTGQFPLGPAERIDLIVDFNGLNINDTVIMKNIGPDMPFHGFPIEADDVANPQTTGQIMQFKIIASKEKDCTTHPCDMIMPKFPILKSPHLIRKLAVIELESTDPNADEAPAKGVLGVVDLNGNYMPMMWHDMVTENPILGDTEIWEIYNTTADAHPIHIHATSMKILNRQNIIIEDNDGQQGTGTVKIDKMSPRIPPNPWERGYKDTVFVFPSQVLRIQMTFDSPGRFVWHCHIIDHEDNEMMRPLQVGKADPRQPDMN